MAIVKFTEPQVLKYKILPTEFPHDQLRWIEQCGRLAYKSFDKMTPTSYRQFYERMLKAKHTSTIEHSNLVFIITKEEYVDAWFNFVKRHSHEAAFHRWYEPQDLLFSRPVPSTKPILLYINGNWTAWRMSIIADLATGYLKPFIQRIRAYGYADLLDNLGISDPPIVGDGIHIIHRVPEKLQNLSLDSLRSESAKKDLYEIVELTRSDEVPLELLRVSVIVKTNRLMTHELVRHRPCASYLQESTRYCVYNNNINIVQPSIFRKVSDIENEDESYSKEQMQLEDIYAEFLNGVGIAHKLYEKLLNMGLSKEHARAILPHTVAADIAITHDIGNGNYGWSWVLDLRMKKGAAPDMIDLMQHIIDNVPILNALKQLI